MTSSFLTTNTLNCPWNFSKQYGAYLKSAKFRSRFNARCKSGGQQDAGIQKRALQAAIHSAALRFVESHCSEPLFHDPYAGCFVELELYKEISLDIQNVSTSYLNNYCLATRFIDDKLLGNVNMHSSIRQVVLLTDGMDTRPFRLKWPPLTMLFDVSFEPVFEMASKKLKEVGVKTSRNSIFRHIPAESSDMQEKLKGMGYRGDRPSIWAIQGFHPMTSDRFEEIIYQISCLAMKDSEVVGEIPLTIINTDSGAEDHARKWIEKVFRRNGFLVDFISYEDVARDVGQKLLIDGGQHLLRVEGGELRSVLFVAQQQRLSDDQLEFVRREMELAEEAGDEDGFEDML